MISQDQRYLVFQDFVDIFKEKYGEEWMYFMSQKLIPSPIQSIAEHRGVNVFQVKRIRRQLKVIGQYFELIRSLYEPLPLTLSTHDQI
jgi:hypothetical protein